MKILGRAATNARGELAGPSVRSAWIRAGLLALAALAIVLLVHPGTTRADGGGFAPTVTFQTSTTRASAHPDARITIDNSASDENIGAMTLSLPDYFWGSLGAVPEKCLQTTLYATNPLPPFEPQPSCPADTKVGTVTAAAKIEDPDTGTLVNGVLSGDVYITEDLSGSDPGGVAIIVNAKVGGVDLGKVLVTGRAVMRTEVPAGWDSAAAPQVRGLDTIVDSVPSSVYDAVNNRFVAYTVKTMQVDLVSKLHDASDVDYLPPLLTNPSKCGTYQLKASFTSETTSTVYSPTPVDYTVDGCDTVHFEPEVSTTFSGGASLAAGTPIGLETDMSFSNASGQPNSHGSISRVHLKMPRGIGTNPPSYGDATDRCAGGSLGTDNTDPQNPVNYFIPSACNSGPIGDLPQAVIGTATIQTPLLPADEPLTGYVYLINKVPIPALAIYVSEDIPGNPKGINTAFAGSPATTPFDTTCGSTCGAGLSVDFSGIPDVPVDSIHIDLNKPDRTDPTPDPPANNTTISSKFLAQASAGDTDCQKNDDFAFDVYSQSDPDSYPSVTTIPTSGCTSTQKFAPTTGPWGTTTTNASPAYSFTYTGATASLICGIDLFKNHAFGCPAGSSPTGTTGTINGASLANGTHVLYAGVGPTESVSSGGLVRFSGVRPNRNYDTTVPNTTLTAGPGYSGGTGTTPDSLPSFTYNSSEASSFQCSLDGGAFLPCGSDGGTGSVNYTLPAEDSLEASDTVHTFAVRAQDTAGNVDLTPAEADFKVVKPFGPTMSVNLTTTQARAHPEMTVTIDNPSHTHLKDLHLNMPDGFFGGLTGVQSLCPVANADAGTCPAGSQVGTVDTTAVIDRSTAFITGKVFLTEPRIPNIGEPAGLTIDVEPKIQDVTFDPIRINARLSTRGEAQGINTATLDIPDTATSTVGEVSTFDLRSMVLKLKDNNLASQPLLTNPSYCGTGTFAATFTPASGSDTTVNVDKTFSGCGALSFSPSLSMSLTNHATGQAPPASNNSTIVAADLRATLTADPNGSGIRNADIILPKGVTLNVQKIPLACQPASYPDNCPAGSLIGTVSAISPLLNEAVTGNVYLLKDGPALPKLFLRLRGRINANLKATNSTITRTEGSQLETTFTDLPDVPISSFTIDVKEFLTTQDNACQYGPSEWNAVETYGGWNGASATYANQLAFDCPNLNGPVADLNFPKSWKPKGAKSTLKLAARSTSGTKFKKVTIKLPKGVKFIKSAFSKKKIGKYVTVTTNEGNTKLKTKCFKRKSSSSFEINFCGNPSYDFQVSFKKGSITTKSKSKKLKFKIVALDTSGATKTLTL